MTEMIDVSVVLVGLNAREFICGCIESLHAARWPDCRYEIIYVDNGSHDDSLATITKRFGEDVRVIANPDNRGYCPAANQGARIARGRHLFFLNDDTIVLDDAIAHLCRTLRAHPDAAVAGSRLLNLDRSDQWSGRRFPTFWSALLGRRSWLTRMLPNAGPVRDYLCKQEVAAGQPFEVDWVSAAALLVSQEDYWAVGGFAEDYYYWHEAVFCDRIRDRGKRVLLDPGSRIVHYEGKGSGARPYRVRRWHIVDFHRGAFRCYCEHYRLAPLNPLRWVVAGALTTRALLLLTFNRLSAWRSA